MERSAEGAGRNGPPAPDRPEKVARNRRGRPRKHARRPSTLAARAPPIDPGSPELVRRKIEAGHVAAAPVELVDIPGRLLVRGMISNEEYLGLRLIASWLTQLRRGFGLREASVSGLCRHEAWRISLSISSLQK